MFRSALVLALALTFSAVAGDAVAQAPRISKPKPVPPATPVTMPPLPPAQFDNTLTIGGEDINARKVDTRMSVDGQVNGRGPYRFLVDSGADTSVVGLRIARDLAAAARHAGDPQRHDRPQPRRPGHGRRAEARAEHRSATCSFRPCGKRTWRRGHDRDRRAGRAAADDGFRKAHHQGRGRAACPTQA